MPPRDLLRPARKALEKLMVSGVRIVWDREGSADDQLDYDTGQVTRPDDDEEIVYDEYTVSAVGRSFAHESGLGGIALIAPIQMARSVGLQLAGGASLTSAPYEVWIPVDAPNAGKGGIAECVYSEHPYSDPGLVGRQFTIREAQFGTLSAARVYIAEERNVAPT